MIFQSQPQSSGHGNRRTSTRESSWAGGRAAVSGDCVGRRNWEWCNHLHRDTEPAMSQLTVLAGNEGSEEALREAVWLPLSMTSGKRRGGRVPRE